MRLNLVVVFLSCLMFCCNPSIFGQNAGFGGKRLVLNGTILNGYSKVLTGGGIEYVVDNNWTIGLGYNGRSNEVGTSFEGATFLGYDTRGDCLRDNYVNKPTQITRRSLFLEGRYYVDQLKKNLVSAPYGPFGFFQIKGGFMDMEGFYHLKLEYDGERLDEPCPDKEDFHEVPFQYDDIPYYSLKIGVGYQYFFNNWLNASFRLSIDGSTLDTQNFSSLESDVMRLVDNDIDHNLWDGELFDKPPYYRERNSMIGFSAYLTLGFMFI